MNTIREVSADGSRCYQRQVYFGRCCGQECPRSAHAGFTVVELLVIIGMLALLMAVLLPAVAGTRPNRHAFECVNQLQQWVRATQMYASENNDSMPRDGMSSSGIYPGTGANGTPSDPYAWFNVLPPLLGEQAFKDYASQVGTPMEIYPFPGKRGKLWHCPSAQMTPADAALVAGGGAQGFFSYNMNLDLKKLDAVQNYAYPLMPKSVAFQKPAAQVIFTDCVFNPRTEVVNASPQFNSVNPACRYRNFTARHFNGGIIGFLDGHASHFKLSYVQNNGNMSTEPRLPDIIWNAPYRILNP